MAYVGGFWWIYQLFKFGLIWRILLAISKYFDNLISLSSSTLDCYWLMVLWLFMSISFLIICTLWCSLSISVYPFPFSILSEQFVFLPNWLFYLLSFSLFLSLKTFFLIYATSYLGFINFHYTLFLHEHVRIVFSVADFGASFFE